MSLTPGSRLGPYEILAPLGAGGMGEVYRARDTRLDRDVAIKILPADLSARPEVRERFLREARAVASLNHPNICTLHDIGQQEGVDFLVLELIEGETLAARLERGPLPLEQALRIAAEIASALGRAHRSGIAHRDLKPGNVMLTRSGSKLLDFGLAKVLSDPSPAEVHLSALRTENRDLTGEGVVLGTFQYMSPEQIEGKEADARTDIFALGAVLYEMVTGKRAFSGKSRASLIASILAADPQPASALQSMVPPALDRLIRTCLAKDPEERWQSAHDVFLQIRWIAEGGSQAGVAAPAAARRRRAEGFAWAAAAVLLLTTSLMTIAYVRQATAPVTAIRLQLLPPEKTTFDAINGPVTLSPDGRMVAFAAGEADARSSLWIRSLDSLDARKIDGTRGVYDPFWSPDGRYIGFGADAGLMKVDVAGGPVQKISDMSDGRGGAWNLDNVILFAKSGASPIYSVPAGGGQPRQVTALDDALREAGHWRPHFLPDGRHFVFLARSTEPANTGLYVASLDSKERTRIADIDVAALPALPGYLLYVREGILLAQGFDMKALRLLGDPLPAARDVEYVTTWGTAGLSVSETGVLSYQTPGRRYSQLGWFDTEGKMIGVLGEPAEYEEDPRLSPDGRYAAVARLDPETRQSDIWILDVARGVASRLTTDPSKDWDPVWSPDGTRIAFASNRAGNSDIYVKLANGSGSEDLLLRSDVWKRPLDWSPDGQVILFEAFDSKTRTDLRILPLTGDRQPKALLDSPFAEEEGRFSPDGKWIAYSSDETGRREVFVQPFPPNGSKWQISTAGGTIPRWRRDGKEIFFLQPEAARMAVAIRTDRGFEVGVPRKLFDKSGGGSDVAADGLRFLIDVPLGESSITPATIVLNWPAALKR